MPIAVSELMEFAECMLLGRPVSALSEELKIRQAISRAYYAGYHTLIIALRARSGNSDYSINHKALIQYLNTCFDTALLQIGVLLEDARELRSDSDYRLTKTVSKSDAIRIEKDIKQTIVNVSSDVTRRVLAERQRHPPHGSGF